MASTPSGNVRGSAQFPILVEDGDDLAGHDQDQDTDDDEPLKNRFASESTVRNQEREEDGHQGEEAAQGLGDRPGLSVSIQERRDVHGKRIRQAWFLENDQTRYKLNLAYSFDNNEEEVGRLCYKWVTWNQRHLSDDISFFKYLQASKKARGTTKKEKKTLKKRKATRSKKT